MIANNRDPKDQGVKEQSSLEEEILSVRRVSTKRAGGANFRYSVLAGAGDKSGKVGVGISKAPDTGSAMRKAREKARKSMININITEDGSIPHEVFIKEGASILYLKPAPLGAGIIAGGSVRKILNLAGVRNISVKIIGSSNHVNNAYALMKALEKLREPLSTKKDEEAKVESQATEE